VATVVAAARNSGVESLNLLVQPELIEDEEEAQAPVPAATREPPQPAERARPRGRVEAP
jgi:hypothetical protein